MKQTIEIEVPDGKKAVWKDDKVIFEDMELPKTWEEFCSQTKVYGEYYIDMDSSITENNNDYYRDPLYDKNLLSNKKAAKQHLALIQLHRLRDCYRQGWEPDYSPQSNNTIWYIEKYGDRFTINSTHYHVSFLSFPTQKLAGLFLTNFEDLIKQAGDLI